mmetsp:Transcript_14573/g.22796  ORF Transcript_14573/g.22796 Transcript_14573/m.22796 type:complete len:318 (-) Transcript_14573:267-1220(-)
MSLLLMAVSFLTLCVLGVRCITLFINNGWFSPWFCLWLLELHSFCYLLLFKVTFHATLASRIWKRFIINDELSEYFGYSKVFLLAWIITTVLWSITNFALYTRTALQSHSENTLGGKHNECRLRATALTISFALFDTVGYLINIYLYLKPILIITRQHRKHDEHRHANMLSVNLKRNIKKECVLAILVIAETLAGRFLAGFFRLGEITIMMDVSVASLCICLMFKANWRLFEVLCCCLRRFIGGIQAESGSGSNETRTNLEDVTSTAVDHDEVAGNVEMRTQLPSDTASPSSPHGAVPQLRRDSVTAMHTESANTVS